MSLTVATLLPDAVSRARISHAIGDHYPISDLTSWSALWDILVKRDIAVCIVDLIDTSSVSSLREVARIRKRHQNLPIVVYADFSGRAQDLYTLGRSEVDGVVLAEQGDAPHVIRHTVRRAMTARLARRVTRILRDRIPEPSSAALQWTIENADRHPTVDTLSTAVVRNDGGLTCALRRAGLPDRRFFLTWGRLFNAVFWLERERRTVESVAYTLGYASASSLNRACRREAGRTPKEFLQLGGVEGLIDRFYLRHEVVRREPSARHSVALHA